MLRIHFKMGPARNKEWTCCFGLHVRTATIMIGLWHLVSSNSMDVLIESISITFKRFRSFVAAECVNFGHIGGNHSKPSNDARIGEWQ